MITTWKNLLTASAGILFTGITTTALAQEQKTTVESRLTPKFGVKGGVNLSNLYVDNVQDKNWKLGATVGVYAKLPIVKGLSIQPEVLYSMKGAQINYNNFLGGSGKYRYNFDYVEVPVTAVINLAKNFNLQAGGYAAFLASVKVKDVDANGNVNGITELNKDNFQSFDYGLVGGLGFDIENTNLGLRYSYGLKNIGKDGTLSGNALQNSKHSVISLTVGFAF
jgi:hypothetical protein